jgi:hypothetical protein
MSLRILVARVALFKRKKKLILLTLLKSIREPEIAKKRHKEKENMYKNMMIPEVKKKKS